MSSAYIEPVGPYPGLNPAEPGSDLKAQPGDQVSVENFLQLTVSSGSAEAYLAQGVRAEVLNGRVVFTRDPFACLPRLTDVKDVLLARAGAVCGPGAVHRLTGHLNGILARHPDAVASTNAGREPVWSGPRSAGPLAAAGQDPGADPSADIAWIYWENSGVRMCRSISGAGIVSRPVMWDPFD